MLDRDLPTSSTNRLTWIENLETRSGRSLADPRHKDHGADYVQGHLKAFGPRKVAARERARVRRAAAKAE
jgi:hypothetical protein